jgi:hypothetical protein
MTEHVIDFTLDDGEPIPVPQVGDKVTALFDDGVSEMYVVESEPLPDGGVRLRFGCHTVPDA